MQEELLQLARDKFDVFYDINNSMKYGDKYLPLAKFQTELCDTFTEDFENYTKGISKKGVINIPRGHSKTEMISVAYACWLLGRNPKASVVLATNGQKLSDKISKKARDLVLSDWYRAVFPEVIIRGDSKAVAEWGVTKGGTFTATSIGGAMRGLRTDFFIIDDPHKATEGLSELEALRAFEWWKEVARGTLKPTSITYLMMQRLSEIDLTQKLLDDMTRLKDLGIAYDYWELVSYPAEFDDGTRLWADLMTQEEFDKLKGDPKVWFSQYQQNPMAGEAMVFKKEDVKFFSDEEQYTRTFTMFDPAFTRNKGSDESAIVTIGVKDLNVYSLDTTHGKFKPDEKLNHLFRIQKQYNSDVGVEVNQARDEIMKAINDKMIETGQRFKVIEIFSKQNKHDKIELNLGVLLNNGRLYIKSTQSRLYAQLLSFPKGRHDDVLDALAMAVGNIEFKKKVDFKIIKPKTTRNYSDGYF
jgi:predicted phage terminase large subunit-like protein